MRRARVAVLGGALLGALIGGWAARMLFRQRRATPDAGEGRRESVPWSDILKLGALLANLLRGSPRGDGLS